MRATSDIWSRSNKSFIAVSVHYIEKETNQIVTEFIACELFEGRHTNDRVAEKLSGIFKRFEILEKVYFITTDAAGEYVAAFKYYGDDYQSIRCLVDDEEMYVMRDNNIDQNAPNAPNPNDATDNNDSDNENEHDVNDIIRSDIIPNNSIVSRPAETFSIIGLFDLGRESDTGSSSSSVLPHRLLCNMNRIGCSSHMLDKVGSIDAFKANKKPEYADIYGKVFAKLESIWDLKASRVSAEEFTRITKKKLIGPHKIRWLKTFDAVNTDFLFIVQLHYLKIN